MSHPIHGGALCKDPDSLRRYRYNTAMSKPMKWAGAAILAGTVMRLLLLGAKSLWFDEASTLMLAWQPLAGLASLLVRNEVNPPMYYALMHFWLKAFSDPRIGLRLFSALCGIGSLFAFRSLADRLLPERVRLPALLFAVSSSFWIHVAQDARVYSLLLLVSILSSRAALELEGKPRVRHWAGYAALAALGLYTHYYYAILLVGHAVWLLRKTKDWRGFLIAHAAVALVFAPCARLLAAQMRMHLGDPVVGEALTFPRVFDLLGGTFFDVSFLGLVFPAWTGIAVGVGFAALAVAAGVWARRAPVDAPERRAFDFALTHVVTAFAVVVFVELWTGRPVTQARYFAPISPMLLMLAALGARRGWTRIAAGVVLTAGVAGYFFSAVMVDPKFGAIAAHIRRSSDSSVPVVYLGTYYYLPMRVYYMPERKHYLVASVAAGMDYRGMPPYPGVIEDKDLPGLGPCVVIDEGRQLSLERVSFRTGAQLAALRR